VIEALKDGAFRPLENFLLILEVTLRLSYCAILCDFQPQYLGK